MILCGRARNGLHYIICGREREVLGYPWSLVLGCTMFRVLFLEHKGPSMMLHGQAGPGKGWACD